MAQLLKSKDGFYVGKVLKNGNLSKDAYHISDREIVAMFEDYLTRYCLTKERNVLEVCRGERTVFEAKLNLE
ncbi:MAG: hypothetical protein PUC18_12735 [Prevotellaceae bacterium]|nr:hypothetical protein [Prevotellaceae bacterium]